MVPDTLYQLVNEVLHPYPDATLIDLRIGLRYTAVVMEIGIENRSPSCGLAATILPEHSVNNGCCCCNVPGPCIGKTIKELLSMLTFSDPLHRTILLGICNAVLCADSNEQSCSNKQTLHGKDVKDKKNIIVDLCQGRTVAMVGFFKPVAQRLFGSVASLGIMEKNMHRHEEVSSLGAILETVDQLSDYETVIITATTLINDTFSTLLSHCPNAGTIILMGPSTPLAPQFFRRTCPTLTVLSGRTITDTNDVLRVVSQGGGTPELSPSTRKIDIVLKKETV